MKALVLALIAVPAMAQLAPFNAAGVTMGHHHIMVPDVDAQKKIWVDALGGELSGAPPLEFVKFGNSFLILTQGKGTDGTERGALGSIFFAARDLKLIREKLSQLGVTAQGDSQSLVAELPGGIKVQMLEDPTLLVPLQHVGFEIVTADEDAERSWWERVFGATTETLIDYVPPVTQIPGAVLFLRKIAGSAANTQGRSLDHTGVNVRNLNEYCTNLSGLGLTCERPMGANTPIAMVTSPAGVRVEINQGLESR